MDQPAAAMRPLVTGVMVRVILTESLASVLRFGSVFLYKSSLVCFGGCGSATECSWLNSYQLPLMGGWGEVVD